MTMASDDAVRIRFMAEQVRKGLAEAIAGQRQRAEIRPKKGFRAELLKEAIDNISYTVNEGQLGVQAIMQVPLYVRFADMRHLANAKVYDRPVWGHLYGETLQDIKYGYREWLRKTFGDSLRQN